MTNPDATAPSLREDPLIDVVREAIHEAIHDRCGEAWVETEVVVAAIRAALSQPAASASLDVERLARALEAMAHETEHESGKLRWGWWSSSGRFARAIAAAYAAIPATDSEEKK